SVLCVFGGVVGQNDIDVSRQFIAGAQAVLKIAQAQDIHIALFKARSPSCGLEPQLGVTSALLLAHGIRILEF
ncbi:MAG: DUF523 domain-containing protein, partial [Candidatus Electrothrix sp. AR3]|nr:DUF523 domain-containing protein [Candidatus Electrothrix sp. AR3]